MSKNGVNPARLLLKAMGLFIVFNFAFATLDVPWGKLSIYNTIVPGRLRVPYEQQPEYYNFAHNLPVFEDFDAMFASHVIAQEKAANEYRIVVLGDSADWGFHLQPKQIFTEQLNARNLVTCDGKQIRVYNLAYPLPDAVKDLLILDHSLKYEPDAVLWFVTAMSLQDKSSAKSLIIPHSRRARQLFERYDLEPEVAQYLAEPTFWDQTLLGRRQVIKKIITLQIYGLGWMATGVDFYQRPYEPVWLAEKNPSKTQKQTNSWNDWDFSVLQAGYSLAGDIKMVVINEPIFIADSDNPEADYNSRYTRPFYDAYRSQLQEWMAEEGHVFLDFWNLLPPTGFSDNPIHRSADGESLLADALTPALLTISCPQR
jgi:hypothetical protein